MLVSSAVLHTSALIGSWCAAILMIRSVSRRPVLTLLATTVGVLAVGVACALPLRSIGYFPVVDRVGPSLCTEAAPVKLCVAPENKSALLIASQVMPGKMQAWVGRGVALPAVLSELPGADRGANPLQLPLGGGSQAEVVWSVTSAIVTPPCLIGLESAPVSLIQRQERVQAYLLTVVRLASAAQPSPSAPGLSAPALDWARRTIALPTAQQAALVNGELTAISACR